MGATLPPKVAEYFLSSNPKNEAGAGTRERPDPIEAISLEAWVPLPSTLGRHRRGGPLADLVPAAILAVKDRLEQQYSANVHIIL